MRIAIMQPYFLPYLGYFKLMHEVDIFVHFDNAQMMKRSWVTRNKFTPIRYKQKIFEYVNQEKPITFSLPVKKSVQQTLILDQEHAADKYFINKAKRRFQGWYPNGDVKFFELISELFGLLEKSRLLVDVLPDQLTILSATLGIKQPEIMYASKILPRLSARGRCLQPHEDAQNYIIRICRELGATSYLNLPGGRNLYDRSSFRENKISLDYICFNKSMNSTPMLSALHYLSFESSCCIDLINKYWCVNNG